MSAADTPDATAGRRPVWAELRDAIRGTGADYTKIPLKRAVFLLAVPMVLELVLESTFAVVDIFFVAKLGSSAVATVGLTETILFLLYAVGIGLAMAVTAVVARRVGEGKPEEAAVTAVQAIWIAVLASVPFAVAGIVFAAGPAAPDGRRRLDAGARLPVHAVGARQQRGDPAAVHDQRHLPRRRGRGLGHARAVVRERPQHRARPAADLRPRARCRRSASRARRSRRPSAAAPACCSSSGSCSAAGRTCACCVRSWPGTGQILRNIVRTSLGGIGQMIVAMTSWIFLMRILADIGSEAVAGATIAIRIMMFTMMPAWGMSNAAATLVGQNLGAGHPERAEASVWRIGAYNMVYLIGISVLFFALPHEFMGIFTADPAVVSIGAEWLRILSYSLFVYGWWMVAVQAFNGAGDTVTPTWINVVFFWLIQIPLSWLLAISLDWQHSGVFWGVFVSETAVGLFTLWLFSRGKWKTAQV